MGVNSPILKDPNMPKKPLSVYAYNRRFLFSFNSILFHLGLLAISAGLKMMDIITFCGPFAGSALGSMLLILTSKIPVNRLRFLWHYVLLPLSAGVIFEIILFFAGYFIVI